MTTFLRCLALAFIGWVVGVVAPSIASASPILVIAEPDDFALGSDLTHAFSGATLSVEGRPASRVIVQDGFSPFNGRNKASTGTSVFAQDPPHPFVPLTWDDFYGLLRVDFAVPTDFVRIDMITDDNDFGALKAFDVNGVLLDVFSFPDLRDVTVIASITRVTPDIAFITAGGSLEEGLMLDNLQYHQFAAPEPWGIGVLTLTTLGLLWGSVKVRQTMACRPCL